MTNTLTLNDIALHTFYGNKGSRVSAFTWEDGPEGVNYVVENLHTLMPLFTSKENFLEMATRPAPAPMTPRSQSFIDRVLAMPE